uniref:Uncharacterized protein n=1 Tax=Panagrolaimus sp. ES5 TaxID=591445 RepID=A0AC34GD81_9BILA
MARISYRNSEMQVQTAPYWLRQTKQRSGSGKKVDENQDAKSKKENLQKNARNSKKEKKNVGTKKKSIGEKRIPKDSIIFG